MITQCCTNVKVVLQFSPIKIRHNIHWINPYTYDTNVEDIKTGNMCDNVNILSPVIYYLYYILKLGHKVYNWAAQKKTLTLIHIGRTSEFFHDDIILFTPAVPF